MLGLPTPKPHPIKAGQEPVEVKKEIPEEESPLKVAGVLGEEQRQGSLYP
jgi:hypothetical protein